MALTIPTGIYFGFTKAEIQEELTRYKAEVKGSGTGLTGASQNGQSYTFGDRKDMTLAEWSEELQAAMAFFGLADELAPPSTVIDFRSGCGTGHYYGGGFN
jgi:hypothetical protein